MQAQIIRRFGGPEVFEAADLPDPVAGPGQVLVRIAAASVNPIDTKQRRLGRAIAPELPAVLGCDFAGIVAAVGPGVAGFAAGEQVYGCAGGVRGMPGTYAGAIAADARLIAHAPANLTLREAAALPLVTLTAWEGLDRAGVLPGDRVLVRGGTGGVGHVVVQLARGRGALVTATASSPEKAALARDLGADQVVDHRRPDIAEALLQASGGDGFDVVFDATGGADLEAAFVAAAPGGRIVAIVSTFGADLSQMHFKGLSLHVVFMVLPMLTGRGREAQGRILSRAAALAEAGRLRPLLDAQALGLADVAQAHARLEAGGVTGKLVLDIAALEE